MVMRQVQGKAGVQVDSARLQGAVRALGADAHLMRRTQLQGASRALGADTRSRRRAGGRRDREGGRAREEGLAGRTASAAASSINQDAAC